MSYQSMYQSKLYPDESQQNAAHPFKVEKVDRGKTAKTKTPS